MKKIVISLLFVAFVLIYSNYSTASDSNQIAGNTFLEKENDMKTQVTGNTDFTFELYGKLVDDSNVSKSNLFFSPYSISTALAMTYGGAKGETQKQMAKVLHFVLPQQRLHPAFGSLQKQLIQEDKSGGYQLLLANGLWGQKGAPFLKEFLDLNQYYGAGLKLLDFAKETEQSRKIINSWVEEKTEYKIKDLIPQDGVNTNTVLVITNTIYFKGEWKTKFNKDYTRSMDFYVSAEDAVKVAMMITREKFKLYEDEKLQTVELPYKGNELSMLILLPRDIEGLKEIESTLSTDSLNGFLSKMKTTEVDVVFPKFKMTWGTFSLKKTLIDLGMPDAFNLKKADFSGMTGKRDLCISDVFHKAVIEVNEEDTEAAAGSGLIMAASDAPPVFHANHPFIFFIKDNRSGSILFMGRVMNPVE